MINLNAYDNITNKIDKTKTWINVEKHLLISREIKFRKYYTLAKRFNPNTNNYDYFIILLDDKDNNRNCYNTKLDDYGRIKIRLNELYNDSDLKYLEQDCNIDIKLIEHEISADVYQLDI